MSQQLSKYGAVEVAEAPAAAATPRRARGVVITLALCAGGALFAVAGPAKSPRLRGLLPSAQIKLCAFVMIIRFTQVRSTRTGRR